MSDLVLPVENGKVKQTSTSSSSKTEKSSGNELGKDAFLKLLTTQMKYQDPLEPNTDTDYIAQLATFSQLEQLQNIGSTQTNSQAFSLVGKTVVVKSSTDNSSNDPQLITGKVDYVTMNNGKVNLSIEGKLYSVDQLDSVYGDDYLKEQNSPKIDNSVSLEYDASNPKDLTFDVTSMGNGEYKSDDVAIAINGNVVNSDLVTVADKKVTISKDALTNVANGSYPVTVVFNDTNYTTVKDKVTLKVSNAANNTGSTGTSDNTDTTTNGTTGTTDSNSNSNTAAASNTEKDGQTAV